MKDLPARVRRLLKEAEPVRRGPAPLQPALERLLAYWDPEQIIRWPASRMNRWETAYARRLELLRSAGAIEAWQHEPIGLRLCPPIKPTRSASQTKPRLLRALYYFPDFAVVRAGELEFHEVKGFWREDARLKLRWALSLYADRAAFVVQSSQKNHWIEQERFG